ncbi:inverse autotransporter beta domain-containing protein [Erwiniaceae bacterium BAC15a-03b]|uniref:Inverse autotransporter beta domain-containing protein n=1 Tax=Winslowiella arboricola TaxID=2978220 RepID=A0A9J6PSZ2_9GAMM|nr:inverse autotransporter beta domain-containing protein [Winslowiella arboricola]MCU5772299.1 inverse autotransporter beta domain-containing protein [Winslowiella arboricola]MCU5779822.1 inverse autotransporter beta domain-containing protein [Winslowiella arboricola]
MRQKSFSNIAKNPGTGAGKLLVISQIAAQIALAISPFYIHSAAAKEEPFKWYQSGNLTPEEQALYKKQSDRLVTAGTLLTQDNSSAAAAGMARSVATGEMNSALSGWLNQFGTARVQLNVDEKFSLQGSQADVLLPLYDNNDTLLFTQLGLRNADQRTTGNIGAGVRTMTGDWMLGVNTFYDNDFTGHNRRLGVGVEAWRDYLKLSGNSYWRLNNWHQSRDFADYDERPANGYDVRVEGWLPAYPQLGAKVMYEQYQGNEVALFGKDNRQKNPWAFTGGVSYTPVPLITVGAEHRSGKSGKQDSQLNLALNYRLGESWQSQIDPSRVDAARLLSGSRLDLVERNNTIVLDYRKQEYLTLGLPESATGKSRSMLPLSYVVKNSYAIQAIKWDSPALIAAGGVITPAGEGRLNITLPAWQIAGANNYTLSGTITDVKGNTHTATSQIVVDIAEVSIDGSTTTATPPSIVADGTSTSVVQVTMVDGNGQPITDMAAAMKLALVETQHKNQPKAQRAMKLQHAALSEVKENGPGVYEATLTSGTRLASLVVTPSFNGTSLKAVTVQQTADLSTAHFKGDTIVAITDGSVADGVVTNQVDAVVTDANDNPIAGITVDFTLSGSATPVNNTLSVVTDDEGKASISYTNTVAEAVTVNATLTSNGGINAKVDTRFIADIATAQVVELTSDKTVITGSGGEEAQLVATVKDAKGNLVPDATVNWQSTTGSYNSSSTTDSDGKTQITLSAVRAATTNGKATVSAKATIGTPATKDIDIRAVLQTNGKYYWTLIKDHRISPTAAAPVALANCQNYGGGRLLHSSDVNDFGPGKADFNTQIVDQEFQDWGYKMSDQWTTGTGKAADLNSLGSAHGEIYDVNTNFEGYVCVKSV